MVWTGVQLSFRLPSDLGFQQLQEEFVHWDFAILLDAVEVLHGLSGSLAEQGEGHEQLACPTGILLVLGRLVVLQGLVKHILELLYRIHIFNVHGVFRGKEEINMNKCMAENVTVNICNQAIMISTHNICWIKAEYEQYIR